MASSGPAAAAPAFRILKGGMRVQMTDFLAKYSRPAEILVGIFLALLIVFVEQVPAKVRAQANTTLGRLFFFFLVALVGEQLGWPLGILMALAAAVLIGGRAINGAIKEGFEPDPLNVRVVPTQHKWFVERVLGENPLLIEDQLVETTAVQDLSRRGMGSVQNSSLTR